VGIWRIGGEPTCERAGEAVNRAIEAALVSLPDEARPLCEPGEEPSDTGTGPEEDATSRGTDMLLSCSEMPFVRVQQALSCTTGPILYNRPYLVHEPSVGFIAWLKYRLA
jgi:hypothetical protein